jgi:acetate kinase
MIPVFLVLNAGSSSLKFQVFELADEAAPHRVYRGLFQGFGGPTEFIVRDGAGAPIDRRTWPEAEQMRHDAALVFLADWLRQNRGDYRVAAVGHRVVHGGMNAGPRIVTDELMAELEQLTPLAPLHQPHNLAPIRTAARLLPDVPQVACFDTAFHRSQPDIAQSFALPKSVTGRGVRRYGFHGLSYAYLTSILPSYDPVFAKGRIVLAHLGNGASLCAVEAGVSMASTMGFSAMDGLPMGTRCGAIDAGVVFYMIREMKLRPDEVEAMLYTKSGLLGVSGVSNDMRVLRELSAENPDAKRAIDLFVYRAAREIGSCIAALGGVDALVFTAGIGENDVLTRAEILRASAWAGFALDEAANRAGGPRITGGVGPSAWVVPTDEELFIAQEMRKALPGPVATG